MRFTALWLGLGFAVAGCCQSPENPVKSEAEVKTSVPDCCDECCSTASRAAILQKSLQTKGDAGVIQLTTVKFDPFMKDVKAQAGKVVCLYQWADKHAPSKKHLGDLVALQQKFGKEGLVCMTVNMDQGSRKETLQHLQKIHCDLANYLQADGETVDAWDALFGCCGIPSVVVYGRNGKKAESFIMTETPIDLASLEKTLVKELNTK